MKNGEFREAVRANLSIQGPPTSWSFLTNHALVLIYLGQRPDSIGLDIAQAVGITERAARKIIGDLQAHGYVELEKIGRRNRYQMDLHHPVIRIGDRSLTVGQLLEFVQGNKSPEQQGEERVTR